MQKELGHMNIGPVIREVEIVPMEEQPEGQEEGDLEEETEEEKESA